MLKVYKKIDRCKLEYRKRCFGLNELDRIHMRNIEKTYAKLLETDDIDDDDMFDIEEVLLQQYYDISHFDGTVLDLMEPIVDKKISIDV